MSPKNCALSSKTKAYLMGTLFLLFTTANLCWSSLLVAEHISRGSQIYMGFQVIFLMPCLPFFFGVHRSARELLMPFLIDVVYAAVLTIVWMLILISTSSLPPEDVNAVFDLNGFRMGIVLGFWGATVICYVCVFVVVWKFWKELGELCQERNEEEERLKTYPYRRFETTTI